MSQNHYPSYFKEAKRWADDNFARITVSRQRYQAAFLASMGLNLLAIAAVMILAHCQTLIPLMVHHYDNGLTTVEPLTQSNAPINRAQVESDVVRYITNRESFDVSTYRSQFDLVSVLSNTAVNNEYLKEQAKSNKDAPINRLNVHVSRNVKIASIHFLDNLLSNGRDIHQDHNNVAEVAFTITDTDKQSGHAEVSHYNALIAWQYLKPSSNPDVRWKNWDGFQVIRYSKQIQVTEKQA
ncbi:hypothetical protein GH742_03185 [Legionella sp. MW5194]|uniref:virB8 family protein n=1 Tax=Legionella sp. MW5194 TaxID=2662448 RepID=UPI00193CC546|nr:type IV secretion system protein [Legionella sp. MW5194]QRN02948.1 hypothetical protein GH742_03185 [Legionella sp. MW5194]